MNGEIAQVDAEAALAWCNETPMSDLQLKGCYHGLGKYLGRSDPDLGREICLRVPRDRDIHPQQCFHGWGWALAESDTEGAASRCQEGEAWRDSCVLGVSANLKRFDPGRAAELCESVRSQTLRGSCQRFLER